MAGAAGESSRRRSGGSARERARLAVERRLRNMPPARRLRLQLCVEALEEYAQGRPLRVLDAGCGIGLLTVALARRNPSWSIVAVDIDAALLEEARQAAGAAGIEEVSFRRADLTGDDLGTEAYDAVVALECLAEIPDADAALRQMAAAVKPGGVLLVHVPERNWKPVLPGSPREWKAEVRHGYEREELRSKLEALGLSVLSIDGTTHGTAQLAQEIRERVKDRGVRARAAVFPLMVGAVWLERRGFTWGEGRALWARARRPRPSEGG